MAEDSRDADGRAIAQGAQFTRTDQEAETSEQQYHLCLTTESRLRTTASKAKSWITGPCSRSRHTFSSRRCWWVRRARVCRRVNACMRPATWPADFLSTHDEFIIPPGKFNAPGGVSEEVAFPSERRQSVRRDHGKGMDAPGTFSGG